MKGVKVVADKVVNRVSFSLEPEYYALLGKIAERMHTNMTVELRRMIDERAVTIGLEPVAPVFSKKVDASSLERLRQRV